MSLKDHAGYEEVAVVLRADHEPVIIPVLNATRVRRQTVRGQGG